MAGFSDNEILVTTRRSGTASDPFLSLSESHKIVNNVVQLVEIPSKKDGITIVGNSITWVQTTSSTPSASQFYPDFNTGKIVFHSSREGLTNTISYVGRGFTAIGTDRVWVQKDGGTVTETLTSRLSTLGTKDTDLQSQITANETDIENKLATHKTSTDHSSDKITYSGTIPSVTDVKAAVESAYNRAGNIIASSGTSSSEVVDSRLSPDGVTHTVLKNRLDRMENKQLAAVNSPVTIKRGLNSVNAPEGGKLDVKIKGKTLSNQMGKLGNSGETLWAVGGNVSSSVADTTQYVVGTKSQKGTLVAASGNRYITIDMHKLEAGKYYYAFVYVRQSAVGDVDVTIRKLDGTWSTVILNRKIAMVANTWVRFDLKFAGFDDYAFKPLVEFLGTDAKDVWIDACGVYEIDSATYNKIDVDAEYTGDKLAEKFPYVDSMKPLTTPYIEKKGKNLLPPFTQWTLHANAVATDPYKLTLNATALYQESNVDIPVLPSTAYTLSMSGLSANIVIGAQYLDANNSLITSGGTPVGGWDTSTNASGQFTTPSGAAKVRVRIYNNSVASGTFTFTNPQLELGSVATTFEPQNNDYAYAVSDSTGRPLALCSNIDGTVADEINLSTGTKFKRHEYMDLDGSLAWAFDVDGAGFKAAKLAFTNEVKDTAIGTKYDGKALSKTLYGSAFTGGDSVALGVGFLYISIADTDSGWLEAWTGADISANDIKAYFYGYKMCASDGSAYVSGTKYWKKITDGTGITSTLPTASYTGYTPYKLQYQLATAVEEAVSVEGLINLHSGLNQISCEEGIIVREKANPFYASWDGYYYINGGDASAYSKNKVDKFIGVYKDVVKDTKWELNRADTANGKVHTRVLKADFDITKPYFSTYILLDKYGYTSNVVDVTASVPGTQKSVLEAVVQQQADTATKVSVVQNQYARKNQGAWISVVFLNAWVNYGGSEATAAYMKDEFSFVSIKGRIKTGTIGQSAFILPVGYRPKEPLRIAVDSNGAYGVLVINTDGTVVPTVGSNLDFSINIRFRAEQ